MPIPVIAELREFGGLATTSQLSALGHRRSEIAAAVTSGQLLRPRRGWVALPSADPAARRAVALGGRLGGASALQSYGIWVDAPHPLIVATPPTASRLPALGPRETRTWITERFPTTSRTRWRVSVLDALYQHARAVPHDEAIASIDSALNLGEITARECRELLRAIPATLGIQEHEIDGRAMSGNETRFRLAARRAGLRVEPQVRIPGVGTVDFVVEGWLITEIDSREHHDEPAAQLADRTRDGESLLRGYGTVRFMPHQVRERMDWSLGVVFGRLRDGRPFRPAA